MKKGRTFGFMVVFLGGFLATITSVYAAHFAAAGVESHLTSETEVRFWFLGVSSRPSEDAEFMSVIPTQFQCTVVHKGKSASFRLSASEKEIDPFTVVTSEEGDTITMTGTLRSHIVFVSRRGVRLLTEITPFEAIGEDAAIPGEGVDTFELQLHYSAQGIGSLLLEALGSEFVTCDANTCTLRLAGMVDKGEIEGHTAGGE
jgi:hypothetical protein